MAGRIVLVLLALLVAGDALAQPRAPQPARGREVAANTPAARAARQCLAGLRTLQARFEPRGDRSGPGQCGIRNAVHLSRAVSTFEMAPLLSCVMAQRVAQFEQRVLQPLARQHFRSPIVRTLVVSGYACRGVRDSGRLSQHALGQAIDISGFVLANGTTISVVRDWHGADARARFLRAAARRACGPFNLVLTPDSDADHADHFHLDMGPARRC